MTTDVKISKTTHRDETKLIRIKLADELFIIVIQQPIRPRIKFLTPDY